MATITTRLGPLDHGRRMALEEFQEAEAEEGYRYELSRGVVEVTKVPGSRHGQVMTNLYDSIAGWKVTHPGVILRYGGGAEFRISIPDYASGRNPDLAVLFRDQPGSRLEEPPLALAVEVVSARSGYRDYVLKREEYLAYGLIEYWIVDFLIRRFTLLIREGDTWREQILEGDRVIPSVVLPGLITTVDDLWLDLDYYDPDVEEDDEEIGPAA